MSVRSWGRSASSWLPGVEAARSYDRRQARGDVTAGIVVAALLVPQGMAYAQLAGLPPETGLYATVACLVAYAVVGPSPTLLLGPDSSLAALIAAAVVPLAGDDTASIVPLAAMLAILVGLISVVGGFLRLGTITELFSKPVRVGYLHGLAAVILAGQLPVLFGFSVKSEGFVETVRSFVEGIANGTNGYALGLGVATLCIIVGGRLLSAKLPGVLVAVVATTAVSWAFGLEGEGVTAVGTIPVGLPTPGLAHVALADVRSLLPAAIAIALVALADTSTLSSAVARRPAGDGRLTEPVDPNREIIGLGVANVACGFMQGFPVSASTTRTMVAASVGSRSQLAGVTGAALVAVVLLAGGDLVAHLPVPVLAAVIIAAAVRMVDLATLRFLWRVRWSDLALSLTATAAVVAFGVFEGIAVAVGLSLAVFVGRSWRPYDAVLGRLEGVKGYHDLERHPGGRRVPGLVVFRFDAPLYFANAEHFRRRVEQVLDEEAQTVAWLLIAAEPITDIDTTAAEMLDHLLDELRKRGVHLAFAELKGRPKDQLRRYGLYERIGDDAFHPTLGRAIDAYVDATGVDWTDWSDDL